MQPRDLSVPAGLGWMLEMGLSQADLADLYPVVPGSFTVPTGYYVNTATPKVVYRGTEEGTIPMVAGRWYQLPSDVPDRYPNLVRDAAPLARAVRLAR